MSFNQKVEVDVGEMPMSVRRSVLRQAEGCVCGAREQDYGSPEDNFKTIANLWSEYLDYEVSPVDVSMMMALLKIARVKGGGSFDSFVDLAGYAACGGEIWKLSRVKFEHDNTTNL